MKTFSKLFLLLIPFLFACKAKKTLTTHVTKCRLDYKSAKTLSRLLRQNQLDYKTFSGKIKAEAEIDGKSTDFTISLRIQKDSVIWASISPALGIEALRFLASKDSIHFMDPIHRTYFTGGYDSLSRILNTEIDLEILQSLLVGNSVEFYEEDERLRPGIDSCKYVLGTIRKKKLRKVIEKRKELKESAQSIWMLDSSYKITRILFKEFGTKREFDAHFTNFKYADAPKELQNKPLVPYNLKYLIHASKTILIDFEYSKVTINKELTFPFTIPKSYSRITKKENGQ